MMNELRIQRVSFEREHLVVEWSDDRQSRIPPTGSSIKTGGGIIVPAAPRRLRIPLVCFPRLYAATTAQRNDWTLIGRGRGVHWESIEEDLSVENFLAAYSREKHAHHVPAHV